MFVYAVISCMGTSNLWAQHRSSQPISDFTCGPASVLVSRSKRNQRNQFNDTCHMLVISSWFNLSGVAHARLHNLITERCLLLFTDKQDLWIILLEGDINRSPQSHVMLLPGVYVLFIPVYSCKMRGHTPFSHQGRQGSLQTISSPQQNRKHMKYQWMTAWNNQWSCFNDLRQTCGVFTACFKRGSKQIENTLKIAQDKKSCFVH